MLILRALEDAPIRHEKEGDYRKGKGRKRSMLEYD